MSDPTAGRTDQAAGARKIRYPSQRILSVAYPDELFAEVRRLAQRSGVSVSEQMRTLVQWGLDSMEPPDA